MFVNGVLKVLDRSVFDKHFVASQQNYKTIAICVYPCQNNFRYVVSYITFHHLNAPGRRYYNPAPDRNFYVGVKVNCEL